MAPPWLPSMTAIAQAVAAALPTPRSETGWTLQLLYTLQDSFSQAERMKAARSHGQATTLADDETVVEPIAPLVPMPTIKKSRPA